MTRYLRKANHLVSKAAGAFRRNEVAWDDIVDALTLAVTARPGFQNLETLPAGPPKDHFGLVMEMVYRLGTGR